MVCREDPGPAVIIYTNSWAVFKGLILWSPVWWAKGWQIHGRPLWGGEELWEELWALAGTKQISIGHVDAHQSIGLASLYIQKVDRLAAVHPVSPEILALGP